MEEQESKYAAELADALKQYADLKAQAADVDAVELMDARLDIRPGRERSAADRVKAAYGEKYDPLMMSVREFLRRKQQQQAQQKRTKRKAETVGNDKILAGVHFALCKKSVEKFIS